MACMWSFVISWDSGILGFCHQPIRWTSPTRRRFASTSPRLSLGSPPKGYLDLERPHRCVFGLLPAAQRKAERMIAATNSRLAIAAFFLALLCGIFGFELATVAQWLIARKRERQRAAIVFRSLIAPVSVGLILLILIPIVFAGKNREIPASETAIRCDDTAVDADVAGDGIRIAVWAQESVLLLIAVLGTFHCSTTGAKEIGAGLAITHISLAIAVLVQADRRALKSTEAILGAMLLDSQNSALSIQLMAKETLASRWQVGIISACQVFGLAVVAVLVSRFSAGVYAVPECQCVAAFWWGWLSDCSAFPARELAIWWTYYASRCLTTVQCVYHATRNMVNFHEAEKFGLRLKTTPLAYPNVRGGRGQSTLRGDDEWPEYGTCPSTLTFMYIVHGAYALTSMASAETTMIDFGIRPTSAVFSVGQIVALVVAGATILRAFWLLAGLFLQADDAGTGFVWPLSFDAVRAVVGAFPKKARPPESPAEREGLGGDERSIACGPLLNFRRMEGTQWFGSVLVVTNGGGKAQLLTPTVRLSKAGEYQDTIQGARLFSDSRHTFWIFSLAVDLDETEAKWEYTLPDLQSSDNEKNRTWSFFVPARTESMRLVFYSGNGFKVGTDMEAWQPALWTDVLRRHAESPFHVMIGGGNQIYNDGIRVLGPLRPWIEIGKAEKRRDFPFPSSLRDDCDEYYLRNYIRWYSSEPFASVNCQIPQINIWDDHDIIRGYGSYADEFMGCDVFRGVGSVAFRYYMLFQHHRAPPRFTYTTDGVYNLAPLPGPTDTADEEQAEQEGEQPPEDEFVEQEDEEPSYILGGRPGPYIAERSHSMYTRLGARMAFVGIDTRTEVRTSAALHSPDYQILRTPSTDLSCAANKTAHQFPRYVRRDIRASGQGAWAGDPIRGPHQASTAPPESPGGLSAAVTGRAHFRKPVHGPHQLLVPENRHRLGLLQPLRRQRLPPPLP